MAYFTLECLFILALTFSAYGILLGRLRQSEEPASNVVPSSSFLFPDPSGDKIQCKTDHGYPGRCVDIRYCHAARQAVTSHSHPVRCGWINNYIPMVCCHPDQVQPAKAVFRPYRNRRRNMSRTDGGNT